MGNILKKMSGNMGLSSTGAGGTRDAFEQFEKYLAHLTPIIHQYAQRAWNEGWNPYRDLPYGYEKPLADAEQALTEQRGRLAGLEEEAGRIPGVLTDIARRSTATSISDAVRAARAAGGGRGGLAFSGGAANMAARAAGGAVNARSSALSNALLQAQNYKTQIAGLQQGLVDTSARLGESKASLGMQLMQHRAGLEERSRERLDRYHLLGLEGILSLAGSALGGGLQGQARFADRKQSFAQSFQLF